MYCQTNYFFRISLPWGCEDESSDTNSTSISCNLFNGTEFVLSSLMNSDGSCDLSITISNPFFASKNN
jgi:hypothetical protein